MGNWLTHGTTKYMNKSSSVYFDRHRNPRKIKCPFLKRCVKPLKRVFAHPVLLKSKPNYQRVCSLSIIGITKICSFQVESLWQLECVHVRKCTSNFN